MNIKTNLLSLLLLLAFMVPAHAAPKESVYDRIMRTNIIRCAYYVWPPFLTKDPNSGKIGGIAHDMMEEVAKQLSLKIVWATEVNFDAMFEGYATDRYDMVCAPISATPARARASDFTIPFLYAGYYMYAKAGDTRFDNNFAKANVSSIRYSSLDGDMNEILGREVFPLATKFSIGQNASGSDPLMAIATGKVDVTTLEPVAAMGFMKANPGKIRQVVGPPVRVIPVNYSIPIGEDRLKAMLNTTLQVMLDTGAVDRLLKTAPDYDATMLRIAPAFVPMVKK